MSEKEVVVVKIQSRPRDRKEWRDWESAVPTYPSESIDRMFERAKKRARELRKQPISWYEGRKYRVVKKKYKLGKEVGYV